MGYSRKYTNAEDFENSLREYLTEARYKLESELAGTKEAIKIVAKERTAEFIEMMDKGLSKEERDLLSLIIVSSMYQSFSYGYGIGRIEGETSSKVFL